MARYIDADRLMTKIHELYVQPNIELWQVLKCVGNSPAADVAPREEIAEEIFAEINSKILAEIDLCNGVLIEFEEAEEPYHRIKGEVSALCKIQDFIAELKKKYTEEKK